MDMKALSEWTLEILRRADFEAAGIRSTRSMNFDLVARRDDLLTLIKLMEDRRKFSTRDSSDMRYLSRVLSASPLLLVPSPQGDLQDGVLSLSHGIPTMTLATLKEHLIEDVPPMVYTSSGGHYVALDGERMRRARERSGISLGALAKDVGVSRRAVQMYESGMGADLEIAIRIEEALKVTLILPLDPFSRSEELDEIRDSMSRGEGLSSEVLEHLDRIGMEVIPTPKCPFDALTRAEGEMFMTSIGDPGASINRLGTTLSNISRVTGNESFIVTTGPVKARNIAGTPLISAREVKDSRDINELVDLIRHRRKIGRR
ncbi:hypothetical protein B6U90_02305 [Thermoplasmatales archaeon ex4484_6]|nr:MAG: hypothetical protein B6U90_02305 [Thermoplasmatales archaeon ex4484_6]RLF65929.1 MAG: hypothetical protein DRN57_08105 [Thermoplasmata archaeon]